MMGGMISISFPVPLLRAVLRSAWQKGWALIGVASLVSCAGLSTVPSLKSGGTHVGLRLEDGLPFVKVKIAGQSYDFLLDTGASDCVISPEMAAQWKLAVSSQKAMVKSAAGDHVPIPMCVLPELAIGSAAFTNVPTFVYDFTKIRGKFTNMAGVIGYSIFEDATLTVDYPRRQLRIEPGSTLPAQGPGVVPMSLGSGVPRIPLKGGTKERLVDIDSGSTGGLEIDPRVFGLPTDAPTRPGSLSNSIGATYRTGMARLEGSVWLGAVELASPIVEVTEGDFRVGGEVLCHTVLCLDQPGQRARLTLGKDSLLGLMPAKMQKLVSPSRIGTGIGFDDRWVVRDVVPGSPGARAGVQIGDHCLSVQGQPTSKLEDGYFKLLQTCLELEYCFQRGARTVNLTVPVTLQVR